MEKAVLGQATTQKLCIFAGPVFADDDPPFSGLDDKGTVKVPIPRAFWKLIVAADGTGLGGYAFLLEQDLSGVVMERLDFDAQWRHSMTSVADLEQRLKLVRFPDVVHNADRFGTGAARAVAETVGL